MSDKIKNTEKATSVTNEASARVMKQKDLHKVRVYAKTGKILSNVPML